MAHNDNFTTTGTSGPSTEVTDGAAIADADA